MQADLPRDAVVIRFKPISAEGLLKSAVREYRRMTARVAIDPNVRVRGNQTYAGLEDVQGTVVVGSHVQVYEPESGLTGPAEVTDIDHERRLVYLAVDWGKLREPAHPAHPWLVFLREQVLPRVESLRREIRSALSPHRHIH